MEKVRLKVLTVPALEPVTYHLHTAFCVTAQSGGQNQFVSGWTVRDAIDLFCRINRIDRGQIILERPFLPQRELSDDY